METTIEITTPDGTAEAYLTRPDGDGPLPGVLFFVDAIGLRDRTREMADRIASWGYVVLVPHVFYRDGAAADLEPADDLRVPEHRDAFFGEAMPRVNALTTDLSEPDTRAYVAALLEHTEGPIGVTGYCMGARLAVRAAGLLPDQVAAVGGFHGGGLVVDGPDSPHLAIAGSRAAYVFGHADQDGSMPAEAIATLGDALEGAGASYVNETYEGAVHGYTMADSSMYDEAATERHFAALRDLLARTLTV